MSFGLTAKERMAQLQSKSAKDAPPPKAAPGPGVKKFGNNLAKPGEAAKDAAKPGEAKKPEAKDAAKPKEEPKKPDAAKPGGPGDAAKKDQPKPAEAKPPEAKEPAKPAEAKPKEEAKKPEPAKPKDEPKPKDETKKPEPEKPKEAQKKPEPPKPEAKPKEEAKAPEPAKPKEEPKKPEAKPAAEPPKPAEQKAPEPAEPEAKPAEAKPADKPAAAPAAAKQPEKPKEEVKPAAPAKPAEQPPKPAEAKPAEKPKVEEKKPAEPPKPAAAEPAKPAAPEPAKPATEEAKKKEPAPVKAAPPPKADVIGSIFYFSGMGSLLGSALAEGVYVPESGQRTALDADAVESANAKRRAMNKTDQIVTTARNQAQALSTDFRNLQSLLESVPTFGEPLQAQPLDRRGIDQPIHGHVYFRQSDHLPLQAPPSRPGRAHVPEVSQESHVTATYTTTVQRFPGAKQVMPAAAEPSPYQDQFRLQAPAPPPPPVAPSRSPQISTQLAHHPPAPPPQPYGLEAPSQPWQDRYGRAGGPATDTARSPRPFGGDRGEVDAGGIKPWQLSHVRGLEAKGYRLVAEPEHASVDADSSSYAPYLVSDRTFNVDRQKTFRRGIEEHPPAAPSPYGVPAFRPPSAGAAYPFAPAVESSMPYCDL